MGDFTKAGLDKGDLEKELEHILISTKFLYTSYMAGIEDLTKEELIYDIEEYKNQLQKNIMPLVKKAEDTKNSKLVNMAYDIRYLYEKLIEAIQERLNSF